MVQHGSGLLCGASTDVLAALGAILSAEVESYAPKEHDGDTKNIVDLKKISCLNHKLDVRWLQSSVYLLLRRNVPCLPGAATDSDPCV